MMKTKIKYTTFSWAFLLALGLMASLSPKQLNASALSLPQETTTIIAAKPKESLLFCNKNEQLIKGYLRNISRLFTLSIPIDDLHRIVLKYFVYGRFEITEIQLVEKDPTQDILAVLIKDVSIFTDKKHFYISFVSKTHYNAWKKSLIARQKSYPLQAYYRRIGELDVCYQTISDRSLFCFVYVKSLESNNNKHIIELRLRTPTADSLTYFADHFIFDNTSLAKPLERIKLSSSFLGTSYYEPLFKSELKLSQETFFIYRGINMENYTTATLVPFKIFQHVNRGDFQLFQAAVVESTHRDILALIIGERGVADTQKYLGFISKENFMTCEKPQYGLQCYMIGAICMQALKIGSTYDSWQSDGQKIKKLICSKQSDNLYNIAEINVSLYWTGNSANCNFCKFLFDPSQKQPLQHVSNALNIPNVTIVCYFDTQKLKKHIEVNRTSKFVR